MFRKKDFLEYFEQTKQLERKMELVAENLSSMTEDKEIKKIIGMIAKDERRHQKIVEQISKIIKNYHGKGK